jgi:hypothetical protein
MQFTWRFAAGIGPFARLLGAQRRLPFTAGADDAACAELALPDLPADHIVVPSFATTGGGDYAFRFSLAAGCGEAALAGIGDALGSLPALDTPDIAAPLDNFITRAPLRQPRLRLAVHGSIGPSWLLAVSVRPLRLTTPAAGRATVAPQVVPALSQWQHADPALRPRICLPTCTAMALPGGSDAATFAEVVARCRHASGIHGVWPLAVHTASRRGIVGCVEAITHVDDIAPLLAAGCRVVASVRFADGELTGAPMPASAGHLVLVRGLDAARVHVNDPAAPDAAGVCRDYAREQFAGIWLRQRGACCIFLPATAGAAASAADDAAASPAPSATRVRRPQPDGRTPGSEPDSRATAGRHP